MGLNSKILLEEKKKKIYIYIFMYGNIMYYSGIAKKLCCVYTQNSFNKYKKYSPLK